MRTDGTKLQTARIDRVRVGAREAVVLDDGPISATAAFMFSNAPTGALEGELRDSGLAQHAIAAGLAGMLVTTVRNERVLLDVGTGGRWHAGLGALPQSLALAGVKPDEVGLVVLSHGHPDHLGGLLDPNGELQYPDAQYVMDSAEWQFWTSSDTLNKVDPSWAELAQQVLPRLRGRIRLTDGKVEIADDLWTLPARGHTVGHLGVRFESDGETLLWFGDAFGHPLGVAHPEWMVATDSDPATTERTRYELLEHAVRTDALVFVNHFAFPGVGRVRRGPGRTTWEPLAIDSS